jgi:mono/diheme cytochrome c family protein
MRAGIERYVDAAELRRLLRSLVVVVGALCVAGLFASIVVPGLRNANRPAAPPAQSPVGGEWGWLDPNAFPPQRGYEIPPLDPQVVLTPSAEQLAQGRDLYRKNCEQCHGIEGRGDGPAGVAIRPPPRDFTRADAWKNGPGLAGIFGTLAEGIPRSSMAPFTYLRPKERVALAHYVKSLEHFAHAEDPTALAALGQALAQSGGRVPNRIPVAQALAKIVGEASSVDPLVIPATGDRSAGARLMRGAVADAHAAAVTLAHSTAWRQDVAALSRLVVDDAPTNGFSTRAALLSPADWQALQAELLRRTGE